MYERTQRLVESTRSVVEQLETRAMMSVTIQNISDSSGNLGLFIRGNSAADSVTINHNPSANTVQVIANGNVINRNNIVTFDVDLGGGNDVIRYNATSDFGQGQKVSMHLDGAAGNDQIFVDADVVANPDADIDILVDGDTGNDFIDITLPDLFDAKLDLDVLAVDGNDTVNILTGTVGYYDNSTDEKYTGTLLIDVELGSGRNVLDIEADNVYFDSTLDIDVKGGNSTGSSFDRVDVYLGGQQNLLENNGKIFVNVDLDLGAGNDVLDVDVDMALFDKYFADSTSPVTRLSLNGGDGNDVMTFDGDMYLDEASYFNLQMKGGNGNDTLNTVMGEDGLLVDEGGILIVNVDGQNQNDTLNASFIFGPGRRPADLAAAAGHVVAQDLVGYGLVDIALKGGQHTDRFNVYGEAEEIMNNATDVGTLDLFNGFILIDGQSNTDTLDFTPGADETLFKVRNIENLI